MASTHMNQTQLEALSRPQLQQLAKREGVKANSKSSSIIQKLFKKYPGGVPRDDAHNEPAKSKVVHAKANGKKAVGKPPLEMEQENIHPLESISTKRNHKRRKLDSNHEPAEPVENRPSSSQSTRITVQTKGLSICIPAVRSITPPSADAQEREFPIEMILSQGQPIPKRRQPAVLAEGALATELPQPTLPVAIQPPLPATPLSEHQRPTLFRAMIPSLPDEMMDTNVPVEEHISQPGEQEQVRIQGSRATRSTPHSQRQPITARRRSTPYPERRPPMPVTEHRPSSLVQRPRPSTKSLVPSGKEVRLIRRGLTNLANELPVIKQRLATSQMVMNEAKQAVGLIEEELGKLHHTVVSMEDIATKYKRDKHVWDGSWKLHRKDRKKWRQWTLVHKTMKNDGKGNFEHMLTEFRDFQEQNPNFWENEAVSEDDYSTVDEEEAEES